MLSVHSLEYRQTSSNQPLKENSPSPSTPHWKPSVVESYTSASSSQCFRVLFDGFLSRLPYFGAVEWDPLFKLSKLYFLSERTISPKQSSRKQHRIQERMGFILTPQTARLRMGFKSFWLHRNLVESFKIICQNISSQQSGGLEHVKFQKMGQDMVKLKLCRKLERIYFDLITKWFLFLKLSQASPSKKKKKQLLGKNTDLTISFLLQKGKRDQSFTIN